MDKDFNYNFIDPHKVVAQKNYGWNLELNKMSWNGNAPKYDIRSWNQTHEKMSKGLSLTKEKLIALKKLLDSIEIK